MSDADLLRFGDFYSNNTTGGVVATRSIVSVTGQAFTQAARINVLRPTGQAWDSAMTFPSNRALAKDDVVLLHFFLRAVETTDETGAVYCQLYAEGPAPAYTKSISQTISAGPAWVEYFVPFKVAETVGAGSFGVKFGFGAAARPQVLEVAGIEALWYGTSRTLDDMPRTSFRYEGREPDAAWRVDAARRIEQYRKAGYTIQVVNGAGLPVPDAQVRMKLRRHAYHFGSAWVASRIMGNTTDDQTYRTRLLELFNAGSPENDLKWAPWIGDWGSSYSKAQTLSALTWMRDTARFHLRGHVLVWPSVRNTPAHIGALITASDPSVPQLVLDHIAEAVTATQDLVPEWDVLNEPFDNHDIMDKYGNGVMPDWFEEAALHHPTAKLYINDYAILSAGGLNVAKQDAYIATIRYILDQGAPLHGVGFQGHFDAGPTGMSRVWEILQRFAGEFPDLEFKVTEFDVDTDDEQLQADYLRDLLTLTFSHPQFTGFQVWGFWEGAHWKERAAMVRRNWEEKPAATAWRQLVLDAWQTDETRTTATDGRVRGRGFLGDYDITVTVGGETVAATAVIDGDGVAAQVQVATAMDGTPRVTIQPLGSTVAPGEPVTLAFEAAGSPAPTITWYKNGAPLDGASASTLTIAAAGPDDEGTYRAEITNALGTVSTRTVKVGVRAEAERAEKLANISTRGTVLGGNSVMIAGFVVEGGPKDVLLRGVGPRLNSVFGLGGVLADPVLSLFRARDNSLVTFNETWDPALAPVFRQVGAFSLAGDGYTDDSTSAALRRTLDPGGYTVHLGAQDGGTGIGLIEAYDVGLGEPLKLVNISTRGHVGSGNDILIAGFVIHGTVPQRVLIRGIGPQLTATFGLPGTLDDPRLTVLEPASGAARVIAMNDDWCIGNDRAAIEAAAATVGGFPLEPYSRDASLVLALEPGSYTVHLAGANASTGIGMVEVYALP